MRGYKIVPTTNLQVSSTLGTYGEGKK